MSVSVHKYARSKTWIASLTLPAMLTCEARHLLNPVQVKYSDVFSKSLDEQEKVTLVYLELLNTREDILSRPAAE